jgi:hypothetical protein
MPGTVTEVGFKPFETKKLPDVPDRTDAITAG